MDRKQLTHQLRQIRLLVLDVDGVLTDGSLYLDSEGNNIKCFYSQDGHGMKMLLATGVEIMLLSARSCDATRARAAELGIPYVYLGESTKHTRLDGHMRTHNLNREAVAYMGDDLIDLGAMSLCGLTFAPADAVADVINRVDYVTTSRGGRGAVRECCELLLKSTGTYQQFITC